MSVSESLEELRHSSRTRAPSRWVAPMKIMGPFGEFVASDRNVSESDGPTSRPKGTERPRRVIRPDELNVRDQFRKSLFELHRDQWPSHTMAITVLPRSVPPTTATCNVMRNGAWSVMFANRSLAKATLHGTCHSP